MSVNIEAVLDFVCDRWDLGECTIRHYLVELSRQCWIKEECFGGKRPFGNSGWKWDVYFALAEGGFVTGTRDEEGNWYDVDRAAAEQIILQCYATLDQLTAAQEFEVAQARVAELERANKHLQANSQARARKIANLRRVVRQFMRSKEAAMLELKAQYERAKTSCELEQQKSHLMAWHDEQVKKITAENARSGKVESSLQEMKAQRDVICAEIKLKREQLATLEKRIASRYQRR